MTGLVDDSLDVSRVTGGLVTLEREFIDLNEMGAGAVEQVRSLIETKGHRLELPTLAGIWLYGDRTRLIQVLTNLLNNATKYTPNQGTITLDVESRQNEIIVRVRDNEVGISAELLSHVFELFSQA